MKQPDTCRFCRVYAAVVLALAVVAGAGTAVQFGWGLGKFGGHEYMMRVVLLSAVRSLAPGVAGSALMIAYVVWAHPLSAAALQAELPRFLKRGMAVSGPGYAVAAAVAIGVGFLTAHFGFAVPWDLAGQSFARLARGDVAAGLLFTLFDAALIVFLAWRYLPKLQASRQSLPMKLVLAWTFGTGLRLTVGLLSSMLLPS